jgi:hypothetical protein
MTLSAIMVELLLKVTPLCSLNAQRLTLSDGSGEVRLNIVLSVRAVGQPTQECALAEGVGIAGRVERANHRVMGIAEAGIATLLRLRARGCG